MTNKGLQDVHHVVAVPMRILRDLLYVTTVQMKIMNVQHVFKANILLLQGVLIVFMVVFHFPDLERAIYVKKITT